MDDDTCQTRGKPNSQTAASSQQMTYSLNEEVGNHHHASQYLKDDDDGDNKDEVDSGEWIDLAGANKDPEETRVMFCALDSFAGYGRVAHYRLTHMRRQSFYALPQSHIKLLSEPPFSYLETLDLVDDAIDANAELSRAIVRFGLLDFTIVPPGAELEMPQQWRGVAKHSDIDKARSTLRQFYRDWTAEGAAERNVCFNPVFRAIEQQQVTMKTATTRPLDVLVPGAGLGRLVYELCLRGCNTEGNEISYHQLFASSYILNHTERAGQHVIFPWIQTFSNHRNRTNQMRGYLVPDVHPATAFVAAASAGPPGRVGNMSMCASDFLCAYGEDERASTFDVVATVFFLDTAPNLIRYLEVIRHVLRPGGVLVNFGPLLWHWENNSPGMHGPHGDDGDGPPDADPSEGARGIADPGSFELTDEEVMRLLESMGFVVEWRETGIRAGYIQDPESMLHSTYMANAWVARKL